ncbi:hypothetical protein BJX65DRAFT_276459 [Aspergillus insuetus]
MCNRLVDYVVVSTVIKAGLWDNFALDENLQNSFVIQEEYLRKGSAAKLRSMGRKIDTPFNEHLDLRCLPSSHCTPCEILKGASTKTVWHRALLQEYPENPGVCDRIEQDLRVIIAHIHVGSIFEQ